MAGGGHFGRSVPVRMAIKTSKDRSKAARRRPRSASAAERLAALDEEIARVEAREERRLVQAARKAGFFEAKVSVPEMAAMFRAFLNEQDRKPSTLKMLRNRRLVLAQSSRAVDARRKAVLGGFLVAQCRHKPALHASIIPDIRDVLRSHTDAKVAEGNLALLDPFLIDPQSDSVAVPEDDVDGRPVEVERRKRTRRLILLGAWVLERYRARADIGDLISAELDAFLEQDGQASRKRELLADLLAVRT